MERSLYMRIRKKLFQAVQNVEDSLLVSGLGSAGFFGELPLEVPDALQGIFFGIGLANETSAHPEYSVELTSGTGWKALGVGWQCWGSESDTRHDGLLGGKRVTG